MKLNEFSKATGLKRTTLQLYDRKGLLKPVSKTESGYWEYDNESLGRASLIIILKESGYTLEEIRKILENGDQLSVKETFKACEEMLRQKVKKLNGYIRYLRNAWLSTEAEHLSELIFRKLDMKAVMEKIGGVKNEMNLYSAKMEKIEEELGPFEELDPEITVELQALYYISLLQGKEPPEGPAAQETLQRIFEHANSHADKSILKAETISEFAGNAKGILESIPEQGFDFIEQSYGKGSTAYILKALDVFGRTENTTAGETSLGE